ncbi:cytochrome P450 [Yinghuangia aomiensis]
MGTAVEEIMRWTSPSPSKRRTATRDAVLGGRRIAAGDKVLVWEGSANRDARAFPEPDRFDVSRDPNPHLAFGQGVPLLPRREPRPSGDPHGAGRAARPVRHGADRRRAGVDAQQPAHRAAHAALGVRPACNLAGPARRACPQT